ncbi:F-box-like protein [Ceratobasidium sp. AG-Ba]|nr:F-box-like protein [Ceratobasidium sp. AG-Ba]QRW03463.1 F-box-like protein [Ceratobasidium sp. AG-Ba]
MIHDLPLEIFARILSFTLGSSRCKISTIEEEEELDVLGPLETLQLVCVRWRATILSTPILWSHVDIVTCVCSSSPNQLLSQYTLLRLGRAASTPPHLHFGFSPDAEGNSAIVASLQEYLPRVSAITFESDSFTHSISEAYQADLGLCKSSARSFRGLVYLRFGDQYQFTLDNFLTVLSCNPNLRLLCLQYLHPGPNSTLTVSQSVCLPSLEVLHVCSCIACALLLSRLKVGKRGLDLRVKIHNLDNVRTLKDFIHRSSVKVLTLDVYYAVPLLECIESYFSVAAHLCAFFLKCSVKYLDPLISRVLFLRQDEPTNINPVPRFPLMRSFGFIPVDRGQGEIVRWFNPIIAAYSLDLVVSGEDQSTENSLITPDVREWAGRYGKLVAIQGFSDLAGDEIMWDSFMLRVLGMYAGR